MKPSILVLCLIPFLAAGRLAAQDLPPVDQVEPRHAIAMYGEPKYEPGFAHFDYVNPDAPQGGVVTLHALGSFDSLHPFTIRGTPAAGIGSIYDTLMTGSLDETFSYYGLIAESLVVPEDRSWVAFNLRPEARFHDGTPITPEDVLFTFHALREHSPLFRTYYANVATAAKTGDHQVTFTFEPGDNRELPLILGQLPVLPAHYWEGRDFGATTLEPPLGSGPYRIARVDPGRSITYERVADYWGRDLPVNRGRHNFGTLRYDYYRDATVALEAFKNGLYDFRIENIARNWATQYTFPAVREGRVRLEEVTNQLPAGMQAWVYNTRRPVFEDRQVRWALAHAFDFEWVNQTLFYGLYERTDSYFENSELAADGLPGPEERALLEPLSDQIPDEVLLEDYTPPSTEGPRGLRSNLRTAARLLEEAGWVVRDGVRVHAETGRPLEFEILLDDPSFERIALPLVRNLERLGVRANVRTVDTAQYQNRLQTFNFDMISYLWGQSLSPGNEQRNYWSSAAADIPGSENLAGIRSSAVDHLIEQVVQARTREELLTRTRALDRVLLWGHYVIPQWHSGVFRIAYWDRLAHPDTLPPYGLAFDTWWIAQDRQQAAAPD